MNQRKENQRISKELVKYLFKNFRSQEPVNFFQILTSSNRGYDRGTPPVPPVLKTPFFTFYIINIIITMSQSISGFQDDEESKRKELEICLKSVVFSEYPAPVQIIQPVL